MPENIVYREVQVPHPEPENWTGGLGTNEIAVLLRDGKTGLRCGPEGMRDRTRADVALVFPDAASAEQFCNDLTRSRRLVAELYDCEGNRIARIPRPIPVWLALPYAVLWAVVLLVLWLAIPAAVGVGVWFAGGWAFGQATGSPVPAWSELSWAVRIAIIAGTIAVALAFKIVRFTFKLKRRFRDIQTAMDPVNPDPAVRAKVFTTVGKVAATRVPMEVHLLDLPMVTWVDQPKWREAYTAFEDRGFEHIGFYRVQELGVDMEFLLHGDERAFAIIYNHPTQGVFANIVFRFENDTSMTFANHNATGLDQHPRMPNICLGPVPVAQLIERAFAECPDKPRKDLRQQDQVAEFCRVWKEYRQWRNEKGTTADEVERIYQKKLEDRLQNK